MVKYKPLTAEVKKLRPRGVKELPLGHTASYAKLGPSPKSSSHAVGGDRKVQEVLLESLT